MLENKVVMIARVIVVKLMVRLIVLFLLVRLRLALDDVTKFSDSNFLLIISKLVLFVAMVS